VQAAREALARGVDFVVGRQAQDGAFADFATLAGEADEWTTAYVAEGLREATSAADHGSVAAAGALERAGAWLTQRRRAGAGWGYNQRVPADADSTAWALIFLGTSAPAVERADAEAALRGHQTASGGVSTYRDATSLREAMGLPASVDVAGWCAPHASVTAAAGRALAKGTTPEAASAAAQAWRYLEATAHPDGSWESYWWTEPHYATSEAVALAFALGHRPADAPALRRALGWLTSRTDGAWGTRTGDGQPATVLSSASAFRVLARHAAEAALPPALRSDALAFLVRMQQRDGGWPAEPNLRIPSPSAARADDGAPWRVGGLGALALVRDHRRTFTSATCVAALGLLLAAARP
jgi:hypothetical protein